VDLRLKSLHMAELVEIGDCVVSSPCQSRKMVEVERITVRTGCHSVVVELENVNSICGYDNCCNNAVQAPS